MSEADAPSAAPTEGADGREIVNMRRFAAGPGEVFGAFRDPARLAQWWGPKGFTNVIQEFDLRPGGKWRLTMRAPDGNEFRNESTFLEVDAPGRVVFQHEEPVHRFRMTMTFSAAGADTVLTWRMVFESREEVARLGAFIRDANEQNFDRLQAHLHSGK